MSKRIACILKDKRKQLGYTPEEVVAMLEKNGFSISTKALYAYENATNMPKVPVFLSLCEIYNIRDIMTSFGYTPKIGLSNVEWHESYYEDFFNATLLEKIYLLAERGIPSFEGYQDRLTQKSINGLSFADTELLRKFHALDSRGQASILTLLNHEYSDIAGNICIQKEA